MQVSDSGYCAEKPPKTNFDQPRWLQPFQNSFLRKFSDFQSIFNAALKAYEEKTQKDLLTHPLATRLQACNSPSEILTALQDTLQAFDQHRSSDERFSTWLKPTINVLSTLSGPGRVLPFVGPIFTGVGVLLSSRMLMQTTLSNFLSVSSTFSDASRCIPKCHRQRQ
ncbi:hypothetical protein BJY52DRAFT_221027 [Lactarius psammicola]|nr:hypothetical protein BJY52DRAFT_221027 [Lactarius psammicola]